MRRVPAFDMPLFTCILMLIGLGIVAIYTATYPKALADYNDGFHFVRPQIIFACAGLVVMLLCMFFPLAQFRRLFWPIIIGMVALLMLVLVVGRLKHGNQAYIELGPIQFQPSEFVKVAIVLTLATFLSRRPWLVKSWKGLINGPAWFLIAPVVLIALEQDLGMVFVVGLSTTILLLIAGTRFRFIAIPMLGVALLGMLAAASGHVPERIVSRMQALMHPEDLTNSSSYHPRNSLIAVGSGGLFGKGLCQSEQKWFYLPAAQNDYILAVISEEFGFAWLVIFIFVPYMFLTYRGFTIAHRAPDEFSALLAMGCTVVLITQVMINTGVVFNLLPSMGINLPFISYGGSSIISSMMLAGLLLNVSAQRAEPAMRAAPITPQPAAS